MLVVRGAFIRRWDSGPEGAEVTVEGGRVLSVEAEAETTREERVILPGFVNAHAHLELTRVVRLARGNFWGWLLRVGLFRALRSRGALLGGVRAGCMMLARGGSTALGDVGTIGGIGRIISGTGLRGVAFRELRGGHIPRTRTSAGSGDDLLPGLSPHAPYSTAREVFFACAESGLRLQTHLAETPLSRDRPGWLEGTGFLDSHPSVVHGYYLKSSEAERLAERGVALVFCPSSAVYFGRPLPPVEAFLEAGGVLALGTDSVASGSTLSMLDEMRLCARLFPSLGARRVLRAATSGGTKALGIEGGELKPGARADFVVVRAKAGDFLSPRARVWATVAGGKVVFEEDKRWRGM